MSRRGMVVWKKVYDSKLINYKVCESPPISAALSGSIRENALL
jgi:hypothetical protein